MPQEKIRNKKEKWGGREMKMVVGHYLLKGHKFEQTPGDSSGQGVWHAAVCGIAGWILS